jgi:hypothetical protein
MAKELFPNDRVVFVNQSVELTKNRIQMLIDLVDRHGGKAFDSLEELKRLLHKDPSTDILVIAPTESLQLLQYLDRLGISYDEAIRMIVKPDWISHSLQ